MQLTASGESKKAFQGPSAMVQSTYGVVNEVVIERGRMTMQLGKSKIHIPFLALFVSLFLVGVSRSQAQAPVFEISSEESWIKFYVRASVALVGKFDKWDANLTLRSPDEKTGVLEIKIDAASVDTGSGMKNGKLKSKDFFAVEQNPYITFRSTKVVPMGPNTFEVNGNFTIRGVSNPEKLTLTVFGKGSESIEINGAMVFDRKDYGMNKGIPFIKIADHVD